MIISSKKTKIQFNKIKKTNIAILSLFIWDKVESELNSSLLNSKVVK